MLTDHPRVTGLVISGIVLVGAMLRLWNLGEASLWLDEAASVQFAGLPWSTLWLSGYDNAPPAYYSLLKMVLSFSDSEFAIRLPSVIFGVLTIPVIYWTGRLVAGFWAGVVAALYLALSAIQIEYSQEARGYSLMVFALAIALLGLLLFIESRAPSRQAPARTGARRRTAGLGLYASGILVALYTNNIAVYFVLLAQLAFVYHWLTEGRCSRGLALRWLLANGIVFALWLPWLYIILTQLLGNGTMAHLSHITAPQAFEEWRAVQGFTFVWKVQPWLDFLLGALCLLGVVRLRERPVMVVALFSIAILGPFLIWLTGFLHPLYMKRTITWSLIGTTLLLGAGVGSLRRWHRLVAVSVLVILSGRSVMSFQALGAAENEDWRAAFDLWRPAIMPAEQGRAALFCSPTVAIPMLYYARHEASLPPLLAWGVVPGGAGVAVLLDAPPLSADRGHPDWLAAIPHDLFLWKRGAVDTGRQYLPPLPDEARWRQAGWRHLEVIVSHCPDDSREALEAALTAAGWQRGGGASSAFKGGEIGSYACAHDACFLPGPGLNDPPSAAGLAR